MLVSAPAPYLAAAAAGLIRRAAAPATAALDEGKRVELVQVNNNVNARVRYTPDAARDLWRPAVGEGDCEDIALAKRQELASRGWPLGALRLTTCRTIRGVPASGHAVLSVVTDEGTLILDNRGPGAHPQERMEAAGYELLARELPGNLQWEYLGEGSSLADILAAIAPRPEPGPDAPVPPPFPGTAEGPVDDPARAAGQPARPGVAALDWARWPSFTRAEMACKCGCGQASVDPAFMDRLQGLRQAFAAPLPVTSGYRCEQHNAHVSTTGHEGPHTSGRAADIRMAGAAAQRLVQLALAHGMTGVGLKQNGPHEGRFVHLDDLPEAAGRPRPTIWTY
ncbi:MAG: transglutaminase-like cysteine peptidase [Kiloniellales bacterium]